MKSSNFIKIYSGISLQKSDATKVLPNIQFHKPICRNDLYQDIKAGVRIVGIIDGEFLQNLAVSPIEILDAMRCGIKVFGASSMGALRAAELDQFGMQGIGEIYQFIKSQEYFNDEYLGQIFYEEANFASSIPLIDIYFILRKYLDENKLPESTFKSLFLEFNKTHFSSRTLSFYEKLFMKHIRNEHIRKSILLKIHQKKYSTKYQDGLNMVKHIKNHVNNVSQTNEKLWISK